MNVRLLPATLALALFVLCGLAAPGVASTFVRGDVNQSGRIDLSDAVSVLLHLFRGAPVAGDCLDAADVNDSGGIDVADAIYELGFLFARQAAPPLPFPACGADATDDDLGCASFTSCAAAGEELRSDKERNRDPDVIPADLAELVAGSTAFACDFYRAVRGTEGNLFYSPYSLSVALAMLYAGSCGVTESEMSDTMHFTLPQARLHPAFNALALALESRGQGAQGADGQGFRLNIANAIWGQTGYSFQNAYLDCLAESYDAGMRLLDFRAAPDPSRLVINDWVSTETEGKIEDLIPPGAITDYTRLVLTNAIYFNAAWISPFSEKLTHDGSFQLLNGSVVTVRLMMQDGSFGYSHGPGYTAVELPYDGQELSMVIVMPEAGQLETFQAALDAPALATILGAIAPTHIQLTMPKFRFESSFALVPTLRAMGMHDVFTPFVADLSGIDGTRDLFVTDVLHKAYIGVNEAGTEAAAATAVIIGVTSVPPQVTIDRPFLFLIRDIATGAILFVGRVTNPAA